jgi:hypothetical protein
VKKWQAQVFIAFRCCGKVVVDSDTGGGIAVSGDEGDLLLIKGVSFQVSHNQLNVIIRIMHLWQLLKAQRV